MGVEALTGPELVDRAAIGAFGLARASHVEVDLGMAVPDLHVGFGAGTEHTTLGVQVFRQQFNLHVGHNFLRARGESGFAVLVEGSPQS